MPSFPLPDFRVNLLWNDGQHQYLFHGGPLEHPDQCREASEAIGFAIATWARMETHIDALIFKLNRKEFYPNADKITGRHPSFFPDKLDLMKKLLRWNPVVKPLADEGTKIAGRLKELADTRNVLAHSVLEKIETQNRSMMLTFNSFQAKKDGDVKISLHRISLRQLGGYAGELNKLNVRLCGLTSQVFSEQTTQQLTKAAEQTNPETR